MLDDPLEKWIEDIGYGCFQVRLLAFCGVGYFAVCAEMLVTVFIEQPVMTSFNLSASSFALLPFCVNAASFVSCFYLGYLSDTVGRKWLFAAGIVVVAVFGLASACSPSWLCLILFRCAVGVGNGCLSVVDYVVFVECTPGSHRGKYSMVVFVSGCLGVLYIAGLHNWMLPVFGSMHPGSWRILLIFASLPMVFTFWLRILFSLETPRYLASQRRYAEAHSVLLQMAHFNRRDLQTMPSCEEFVEQMESMSEVMPQESTSCFEELLNLKSYSLTFPLMIIWFLQSTTYWGFTLFLPVFLTSCSVPSGLTIFCMVAAELPGGVAAAFLMDKLGRFSTLRLFMALALVFAIVTTISSASQHTTTSSKIFLMVGSIGIYMFLIPIWSVLFMLTPEAYPASIRARASGLFQTVQGIPGLFTPFLSALLASQSNPWYYMLLWSVVLVTNLAVAVVLLPRKTWNGSRIIGISLTE